MTKIFLALLLLSPLAALAASTDDAFHGWVECSGRAATVTVDLKFGVFVGGNSAHFSYVDSKNPSQPWVFNVNPKEIMAATVGPQYANFAHGHHNTVIKLMADGDIFSRPTRDKSPSARYFGKLFLQTGNGDHPQKQVFKVTCKNDLLAD